MMTQSATTHKNQVHIEIIDPRAGLYAALSSDQTCYYTVNVAARSCSCPAGAHGFRSCKQGACKHLIAARTVARALASMTPAERVIATRMQNIRVNVAAVDVARLNTPLARPVPGSNGEVAMGLGAEALARRAA
jgi:hypothetical protein